MSRYHVDTPAQLVLVQVTLDKEFGLRDAAGNPTPREQLVTRNGGRTYVPASSVSAVTCYDQPGRHWPLIDGGDGTAALHIAELASIDAKLGRTVSGVALPTVASLVQVTRPRGHSALPTGVRDKLDDAYVDRVFAGLAVDNPGAIAEVTTELQGRATAALARKTARGQSAALEAALGMGRSR